MDIKEFRRLLAREFEHAGFQRQRRRVTPGTVWVLAGQEVDRAFQEHAIRRPWGLRLSGSLALDVPRFREWLEASYPAEEHGIMSAAILNRHIANDMDLCFDSKGFGEPPVKLWIERLRGRLERLPENIDDLLHAFRDDRQQLASVWGMPDYFEASLEYFEIWSMLGDVPLPPPQRLDDGSLRLDPEHQERLRDLRASLKTS